MITEVFAPVLPVFDCAETVRRLWDYLDRELGTADVAAIDAHLAQCDKCPRHFAFARQFLAAVRAARTQHIAPDTLRARVRATLGLPPQNKDDGAHG